MRRSEREGLARAVARLLGAARRVLVIGAALELSGHEVEAAPRVALLPRRDLCFDAGVLWLAPDTDLRGEVRRMRGMLADGAELLVAAPSRRPLLARVAQLLDRVAPPPSSLGLEVLCEALLLAGLGCPRVQAAGPAVTLVSALVPARRPPLDAFFEQPAAPSADSRDD